MAATPRSVPSGTIAETPEQPASADAPQTLTFVFTDVEGSTRLWEQFPGAMRIALERHDTILRTAIADAEGDVVKSTGDGLMAVFGSAGGALTAGIAAQRGLASEPWPKSCSIRVRMGLHTGEAERRAGDYFGPAVNRAARVMSAGHGGQILLSGSTATLVADRLPDAASLRDLGEHRLKDLERPERLFQLVHPDLSAEFPPLATLDLRPNNLPTQTSGFVGRDGDLQALRARIDDANVRLLTLTGPGGTGKTRLALRAAADQIDRFVDGVFFVDLASARDADTMLALVASAVGLVDTPDRSPIDEVKRQLRPQQVLLVLDNFEQVTAAAPTLVEILNECPRLKLLVTSREALHVRGENLYSVLPLSLPETTARSVSAAEVSQFEAIQLFVERARAVMSDFHLTDDNAAAVAEICRRLDGLPLAIELATARINLFSPEALRDRLRRRLKVVGAGPRDLPVRQQTLRATIDWSYQLLQPGEQRLFEALSIFSGASFDVVEEVFGELEPVADGGVDVIDGLASLVDKSLVRQTEGADGEPRLVMLETIREYATEQLEARPDFAIAARRRHAAYFAQFAADEWKRVSDGTTDQSLAGLTTELENLRVAWRQWAADANLDELNRMVDGLWHLYEARGWYHATIELINDLLRVLSTQPSSDERWKQELTLRTSLARALTLLKGYSGEVEDAYADALALFEGHRELPQVFPVLRALASFYGYRGEFDKTIALANEILRLADTQDDASMRVDGLFMLGSNVAFAGDIEAGLAHLDDAIRWFESATYRPRRMRLGNDPRVACLTTSGFLLWLLGRPDQAAERAVRAVALASQIDHPYSLAYALFHSGFIHAWRREPAIVMERALDVLRLVETNDFPIWRALGTCLLGAATSALGQPDDGLRQISEGLDQYHGLRTPPVFWPLIRFLHAGAHVDARRPEAGLVLIDEAIALAGPNEILAPILHIVRGDLALLLPDVEAGAASYTHAFDVSVMRKTSMPALRAATRLVRIAAPDEREQRLAMLRSVYETMTEGHATPDLIDAAEILGGA